MQKILTRIVTIGLISAGGLIYTPGYGQPPWLRGQAYVSFRIAHDGSKLVFAATGEGYQDIYALDLHSMKVARLAKTSNFEQSPAFSPDDREIVYGSATSIHAPQHIFVMRVGGSDGGRITAAPTAYDDAPSYSADGKKIVFARANEHRPYSMGGWTWDAWDIYTTDTDGRSLHRLTRNKYYELAPPSFSPDGTSVVFAADEPTVSGQGPDVFVVNADGSRAPHSLTNDHHSDQPAYSPDGKTIAFISDRVKEFSYELYTMGADGSHQVQITHKGWYTANPVFTPDSKHILFLADTKRDDPNGFVHYDIWEVDTDGKNLRRVADSRLFAAPLHWKPGR